MLTVLVAILFGLVVFRGLAARILRFALRLGLVATVAWMILNPVNAWFVPGLVVVVAGVLGSVRPRDLRAPRADRTARTSVRG
jgi:hypothetical protein